MREQIPEDLLPFSPIIKAVSTGCNLRCDYCFYSGYQPELKKMDEGTLEVVISRFLEASPEQVEFIWHGGEPTLMGISFYQKAIALEKRLAKPGQRVRNSIQTNGTLIDGAWAQFLKENHWSIEISLDGPKGIHGLTRKDATGNNTYEASKQCLDLLKELAIPAGCIAVVNRYSIDYPEEIFSFFYKSKIPVKLNRCTAKLDDPETVQNLAISPQEYTKFLIRIFNIWLNTDDPNFRISPLKQLVSMNLGYPTEYCQYRGACGKYMTVDYNGEVYPCDEFKETRYLLGDLTEQTIFEIIGSRRFKDYHSGRKDILEKCQGCQWINICNGDCIREWGGKKIIADPKKEEFCQERQLLFSTIKRELNQRGYK